MDPISVSASILGLLGAAAKVSELLTGLVHGVKDAPRLARRVIAEVEDLKLCLQRMQELVLSGTSNLRSRKALITVDQFCIILTHTVMTFSELEDALDGLRARNSMLFGSRLKWIAKEPTISRLLQRLQSSKLSLNLILTTLSCAGLDEAQQSIQSLTKVVRDVLTHNQEICRRLERSDLSIQLKHQSAPSALESFDLTDDDTSALKPKRNSCAYGDVTGVAEGRSDYAFSFDKDLHQSRVYTRVSRTIVRRSDPDLLSLPSSSSCSIGSSFFSGLSLADVSNISLVSLPVAAHSLFNGQRYREPLAQRCVSPDLFHKSGSISRSGSKILILGISNAGKSTILKQLQLMQGIKPTPVELEEARTVIRTAVIDSFRRVLSECIDKRGRDSHGEAFDLLSQYSLVLHGSLKDTMPQEEYFDGALVVFNHLWKQQEIKWAINAKVWPQTPNNIPYIMDNLVDIFWGTPSHACIANLCMHIKTTGIYKSNIATNSFEVEIYDVGGTRSCRRKWIHCMADQPDYLIYVVDLNGYCQNLVEDPNAKASRCSFSSTRLTSSSGRSFDIPSLIIFPTMKAVRTISRLAGIGRTALRNWTTDHQGNCIVM